MTKRRLAEFAGRWSAATARRAEDTIRRGRSLADRGLQDLFGE